MIFFPRSQSAADSQTPGQLGWRKSSLLVYPSAILLTTFLSFLGFHNYPLLSLESLIILGGALGLGLTFSTLIALGGHWLEVPIAATLLAFFADVQFDWRLRYVLVFGLAMLAAGWLVRRNLSQIMGAVFATVLVTTVVLPTEKTLVDTPDAVSRPAKDPDLAPLVHIVLDEHVGIEGIPGPFNKPAGSKDQIKAFYQTLGFRLYGNAYTRYANTEDSLPNILNFTRKARNRKSVLRSRDFIYLDENEYFRQLSRKGYVMRIYQSQFMDFCRSRDISVESCESYNYTGLDQLDKLASNPATKSLIILSRHLNRSRIYGILRSRYQNLARQEIIPIPILENNNFAPLAALPFFDRLGRDLKNARRGVAYFAHLLIPHRPFMFDEACNVVL
ncbi:MAG: hypothetical protein QGF09_04620, partial [Rhodospirillales bacterium]|nr:hypothetical protein [Rhodospirillales bacterium]